MVNLIVHSPRSVNFLDDERLARLAPSVFAEAPAACVSDRYSHARTIDAVHSLRDAGWLPTFAAEHRTRLEDRAGFQKHVLRFAQRHATALSNVGDTRVELVLSNSHDGTASFRVDAGLYRLACSNGLVVSDAAFAAQRVTHHAANADRFIAAAQSVADVSPEVTETVARWQGVRLTEAQRNELAARSLSVRWDDEENRPEGLEPSALLKAKRYGDDRADLWTQFNVVQENLVRGFRFYPAMSLDSKTVRKISNPSRMIELNKKLWAVTDAFAAEVGAN